MKSTVKRLTLSNFILEYIAGSEHISLITPSILVGKDYRFTIKLNPWPYESISELTELIDFLQEIKND